MNRFKKKEKKKIKKSEGARQPKPNVMIVVPLLVMIALIVTKRIIKIKRIKFRRRLIL